MPTQSDLRGLSALHTEQQNPHSRYIDEVSAPQLCQIINNEDATVAGAVQKCIPIIAESIEILAERVRNGGRVIYVGAGTSGRLGVLDASEIPPTYSAPERQFVAIIAGGDVALRKAQEGAEDNVEAGVNDLKALNLDPKVDSLVGLAASGRTPYVLSCLSYAKYQGCFTVGVACTEPSRMSTSKDVDCMISAVVGPEVVTGSTRMKSGTATKLVLNMLSTGVMIKIGKTFGNMMVDLRATNLKLQQRSRNILRSICGSKCPERDEALDDMLSNCGGSVKTAIASLMLGIPVTEAVDRLNDSGGSLAKVLKHEKAVPTEPTSNGRQFEYSLCVDGGGSKCAAAIISADGTIDYGEAGGCNVTDAGVEVAMLSISLAIQRAADSSPVLSGRHWDTLCYSSIWVGLAGYDRPKVASQVNHALERLFHRKRGPRLRITNDIELLALPFLERHNINNAIVLIAGTGSVAMRYKRDNDGLFRISRFGGWGHLIGDDGSGFDIGRRSIRHALAALDDFKSRASCEYEDPEFDELTRIVLQHFQPDSSSKLDYDLLSEILNSSPELPNKERIAQLAKVVVELSEDVEAQAIVSDAVQSLVRLVRSIAPSRQLDLSDSALVLAGGLMQNDVFKRQLEGELLKAVPQFKLVEVVKQPALLGSQHLLQEELLSR
ncbi:uncharacterized protein A1O9_03401 [Exophiala aquamarina CBS 119918]|uniref:N-acetyl-D-glucosamine kinase n=1 Tax=Exophiala aquamarina CBS 119918 TaxID=1182545 RepID=A0A072PPN8_9EURO|nr:uncharacterized protein A1O9_03401 [Exophiala aquamarina CBS 119918]KEF61831.1 hypothetical protein A1O9_03401 [Exophiala aquamarina CBS 119918]